MSRRGGWNRRVRRRTRSSDVITRCSHRMRAMVRQVVRRVISMSEIDPRAIVASTAKIGKDAKIGAFAVVGDEVELGDGCILDDHAIVRGPARLGRANHVYSFAVVGGDPQDLTYK